MTHTTEDNFQHFLSYSGLGLKLPEHIDALRLAYFHGADEPTPDFQPSEQAMDAFR